MVLLLLVVELLAAVDLLALEVAVGLTAGVVILVVLLTTGSLRLDLPRLPLPRIRPLVVLRPPVGRVGELGREGRGDLVSEERERERELL